MLAKKFVSNQETFNKEFTRACERLKSTKIKIFEEGKITEYLPKDGEEKHNIEELLKNKEKALDLILPKVNSSANKSTGLNEKGLLLH